MNKVVGFIKKGLKFLGLLIFICVLAWLFKSTLFSVYYIPSLSMYPALKPGDYVLVTKFPYNFRSPEYYPLTKAPFPYFYIGGLSQVQRNDIVVFDLPLFPDELHHTQKEDYIKRCIGLPGDTLIIFRERIYVQQNIPLNISKQVSADSKIARMQIPYKGERIMLADSTKAVWESILIRDGNNIEFDPLGNIYINGKQKRKYQVQQNYYFVKGDNERFSSDSRSWGLVPKSDLIGRAELVLWPWPPRWL